MKPYDLLALATLVHKPITRDGQILIAAVRLPNQQIEHWVGLSSDSPNAGYFYGPGHAGTYFNHKTFARKIQDQNPESYVFLQVPCTLREHFDFVNAFLGSATPDPEPCNQRAALVEVLDGWLNHPEPQTQLRLNQVIMEFA